MSINDDHPDIASDLGRGQTNALISVHRLDHPIGKGANLRGNLIDWGGPPGKYGITVVTDSQPVIHGLFATVKKIRMEIDFNLYPEAVSLPFTIDVPVAIYGTSRYGDSNYGGDLVIKRQWKNLTGIGYWGSFHIQLQTNQSDVRLYALDIMGEAGGNI